jgi:hypothetical protein
MVRNTTPTLDEHNDRTRGISVSPERAPVPRRSFAVASPEICDPPITREVIARADADFARIFGSNE